MQLLTQVITSWQVIAITVALVLYMSIVFRVAKKSYYRPKAVAQKKMKKGKAAPGPEEVVAAPGATVNEELGLDEE